jgi:hypothetical protein
MLPPEPSGLFGSEAAEAAPQLLRKAEEGFEMGPRAANPAATARG